MLQSGKICHAELSRTTHCFSLLTFFVLSLSLSLALSLSLSLPPLSRGQREEPLLIQEAVEVSEHSESAPAAKCTASKDEAFSAT